MPSALAVFARDPALGRVKTRMQARFAPEEVLELYRAMLLDTLELAASVRDRFEHLSIYWDTTAAGPAWALEPRFGTLEHRIQEGVDLGERMYNALSDELARGNEAAVVIGSDSPDLPPEILVEASERLGDAEWVLGPSGDGGYYLVGTRRLRREPFTCIAWGSATVLEKTIARLERLGAPFALLPRWHDLDRPEDLERLAQTSGGAPNVRRWLRSRK